MITKYTIKLTIDDDNGGVRYETESETHEQVPWGAVRTALLHVIQAIDKKARKEDTEGMFGVTPPSSSQN